MLQSCPTLCNPMDSEPTRLLCPWDSPGKNTGVGCHALLPNPGWNLSLMSPALAGEFFTTGVTNQFSSVQFCHKSCLTLCNAMDCSMPGFPVHHQLLEFPQTQVPQCCHPTVSSTVIPFSCPESFPASGSFQMSLLFTSGGQSIRVSASASVLPMNIQD